jgi:antirestriction protein ArdC
MAKILGLERSPVAFLHITVTSRLLGILRGDKTAIIHAAAKAEQAFGFLKSFGSAGTAQMAGDIGQGQSTEALAA